MADGLFWFSSLSFGKDDDAPSAQALIAKADLEDGTRYDHQKGDLLGRAVLRPYSEHGKSMWNLKAFSAVTGQLAIVNFYFDDRCDAEWAVSTWHSVKY